MQKQMEKSCSLLVHFDKGAPTVSNEIKEALEGNDVELKIDSLKKAIVFLLNGETIPRLFVTIIRHVLPSEDHTLRKLLLLHLEIIDKVDPFCKVLPEMILVCQNLRNYLQHPNEYLHCVTLRFLCRLFETDIIEPLIPSILSNLDHRHPFVRRNTILTVISLFRLPDRPYLLDQAPDIIEKALSSEQNPASKHNAFLILFTCVQDCLVNYLFIHVDQINDWGEQL